MAAAWVDPLIGPCYWEQRVLGIASEAHVVWPGGPLVHPRLRKPQQRFVWIYMGMAGPHVLGILIRRLPWRMRLHMPSFLSGFCMAFRVH